MTDLIRDDSLELILGLAVAGLPTGWLLSIWAQRLCRTFVMAHPQSAVGTADDGRPNWLLVATPLLFAALGFCAFKLHVHETSEVRPDPAGLYARFGGYLVLLCLMLAATATDFREYIIPDQIALTGMVSGVLLATVSGDSQLLHLWVDWNHALEQVRGPYIPGWIAENHHWHGLAWSLAGLLTGAGITWLIRASSSLLLGQESLGLGDVTLMGMIGSFLGWQPVIFVILLAPAGAVFVGLTVRLLTNRSYVPYGPYLCLAAVAVLLSWRWLWRLEVTDTFSVRLLFGDAPGLAILAGISAGAFVVLLLSLRLYRLIPGKVRDNVR